MTLRDRRIFAPSVLVLTAVLGFGLGRLSKAMDFRPDVSFPILPVLLIVAAMLVYARIDRRRRSRSP